MLSIYDPLLPSRVEKYCMPQHGNPGSGVCLSHRAIWLNTMRWAQIVVVDLGSSVSLVL